MNIGIFGIGAIGSVIAHTLSTNEKLKLFFFNRSNISAIKVHFQNEKINYPISINPSRANFGELDWIIVCLKAYHFDGAISDVVKMATDHTRIAVLQNGIKTTERYQSFFPKSHLLEVSIDCPTQPMDDAFYKQFYPAKITVPDNSLGTAFSTLFSEEKCSFYLRADFKSYSWKKVCESAGLGGIMCLSGNTAKLFKGQDVLDLYQTLLTESVAVAKADGAVIESDYIEQMLRKAQQYENDKGSSMLTDRLLGKPIEWEARNGVIVELGRKYKIPIPTNEWMATFLKYINS